MSGIVKLNRREFLKGSALVGGRLILGFYLPFSDSDSAFAESGPLFAPNAFIRIDSEGLVTFVVNKSEMGQGVFTSLPMLIAEELECDLKSVRLESSPIAPIFNSPGYTFQLTAGSSSVRAEWERLSQAGAAAREMLIAAGAETWKVDTATCRAENGSVVHLSGKSLKYGDLVDKAAQMPLPKEVRLKNPDAFKIVGKPIHRLDNLPKISGTAQFGLDIHFPEMLTAVVARSPVFGGKVLSFNADKARAIPGVRDVVQVSSGVAVVAVGFWEARKGRDALEITWDEKEWGKLDTTEMRKEYSALAATPGIVARKEGDPAAAMKKASKRLSAEYGVPYLAHAPMEPLNCVVDLKSDSCDIWTGSQAPTGIRDTAVLISGLKEDQIKVHTPFLGGGFGRRGAFFSPTTSEAIEIARVMKKPVKVVWTREDDIQGGFYRPLWHDRLSAGLDENGRLISWQHTIVGQSLAAGGPFEERMVKNGIDRTSVEGAQDLPYAIPNISVDLHSPKNGVPVFFWRSVGHSHTGFVVEGFLDEAAHIAGKDPFEFRKALLKGKPRHLGVLQTAAKNGDWGKTLPSGHGRGIAVHESFGSFAAHVAEVSVNPKGEVRVHRVVCAIDCGKVVNPEIIKAQMESAIVFGLSAALYGEITLKAGRVEQSNFHDYRVLRISEMPLVEVHLIPSQEKPGGVGEPGLPPIASAVANAIFAASGARLRSLPMTPDAIFKALKG